MGKHMQVSFMPWAGLEQSFSVGDVTFWPWKSEASARVSGAAVRRHLDRLFGAYVNHRGTPVQTITVCSDGDSDFRPLNEVEQKDLLRARSAIFFSSFFRKAPGEICSGFCGNAPPTADVFALVQQNFSPGKAHMAVSTRSSLLGGFRLGEISFAKPFALGGGPCEPDAELLMSFDDAVKGKLRNSLQERVFRALEWFRLSHIEEGEVSETSRVVMMATAFELLLQAYGKRDLARAVDERTPYCNLRKTWRMDRGKKKAFPCSAAAAWLWDFYDLRSAIVHGEQIPMKRLIYSGRIAHLNAAEILFWAMVKMDLIRYRCGGTKTWSVARKFSRVFKKGTPGYWADFLAQKDPVQGEVLKALGWSKRRARSST